MPKLPLNQIARVCISGGFDPIHVGHVRLIKEAARYGKVIVILNSDEWLVRKKGYAFMAWKDRAEILNAIAGVTRVEPVEDSDGTVLEALKHIHPDYFANGGDRTAENTPEMVYCLEYGIKPLWGIGGEKVASSSEMVGEAAGNRLTHIRLRPRGKND